MNVKASARKKRNRIFATYRQGRIFRWCTELPPAGRWNHWRCSAAVSNERNPAKGGHIRVPHQVAFEMLFIFRLGFNAEIGLSDSEPTSKAWIVSIFRTGHQPLGVLFAPWKKESSGLLHLSELSSFSSSSFLIIILYCLAAQKADGKYFPVRFIILLVYLIRQLLCIS